MAPLGLFPVLLAMVNLNLIQTETEESLGVTLSPVTEHIPVAVVDKDAFIHSGGKQKRELGCTRPYYSHPNETHCCLMCHRGTYIAQHCLDSDKATKCLVCPPGSYMPGDNHSDKCLQCLACRGTFGQITVSNCTSEHNTVCGCKSYQYQSSDSLDFMCKNCSSCPNGRIRQQCTKFSDTICTCLPGFFLQKNENKCYPCSSCNEKECESDCDLSGLLIKPENYPKHTVILTVVVFLLGTVCVSLLVSKFLKQSCWKRFSATFCSYVSNQQPTSGPFPKEVEKAEDTFLEQNQAENLLPQKATSADLPDCVIVAGETQIPDRPEVFYTVVDHVPLSRWNEFVRRLGLTEVSIERFYAEHRHIREAQYAMLRQWRQQACHGATVVRISDVLNQMELSGCSEAIQEVLTKLP